MPGLLVALADVVASSEVQILGALASPAGLAVFAYLMWKSNERLGKRLDAMTGAMGKLASRIDFAAGRLRDVTPAHGVTLHPPVNGDD